MKLLRLFIYCVFYSSCIYGQSVSFSTYTNPVIPGDHPDPTLTKVGHDFYTTGSSFNPTPKIYHSTDLVHWEVISQPVSAAWVAFGDEPGGGIWGGHMVYYNNYYWHFFGRAGIMYYVKADDVKGPWSAPTSLSVPAGVPGLGQDNSIFIDENNRWYLLAKNGRENNWIVELGEDGQPSGDVLDLTWLNPDSEGNPYGWAEGPVMWKHDGYYYYSFAQHLSGAQYVMRSDTLTEDESSWTVMGTNIFTGSPGTFNTPNHISPAVLLDDGTSWVIAHSHHSSSSWYAQGRQGLLCKLTYNEQGFPIIQYPSDEAVESPDLPTSGIPWMIPHSDFFESDKLDPEWSFLGYTPENTYSLSERPGWLRMSVLGRLGQNTVIKNDGEHNYSLITRVDFDPEAELDEAGLWLINGPETLQAKVFSSINGDGIKVLVFSFDGTEYEVENMIGNIVWLKLIRNEHTMSGFFSPDGFTWMQIGESIDASAIDLEQTQFNDFTGNQQGLYVRNKSAFFDLYIYRDAYFPIMAANPANHYGTSVLINRYPPNSLINIHNNDWALYAGVEFGDNDFTLTPDSIEINASCGGTGGVVEVWLDSIDTGEIIAEVTIVNTGGWDNFETFTDFVDSVFDNHDIYLRFRGSEGEELFRINWFQFIGHTYIPTPVENESSIETVHSFSLDQNYPNPFNPSTNIKYSIPTQSKVVIKVFDMLGNEIKELLNEEKSPGNYKVEFNALPLASGIYFYKIQAGSFVQTKKMILLK